MEEKVLQHRQVIRKAITDLRLPPNLTNYERVRQDFAWAQVEAELAGLPGGGFNIAYEAVDRHALGSRKDHVAFRWIGRKGEEKPCTYAELAKLTNRFANVLRTLGLQKGDRLFILAGQIPELYVAALGALKRGVVVSPLFSAFGPEPIQTRLTIGEGKVLMTTEALYKRKIAPIIGTLPALTHILLAGERGSAGQFPGTLNFSGLMAKASEHFEVEPTAPEDEALLHFTSGTTGRPRGRSTCTRRGSPITPPASTPSICIPTTSSGAPPTPAGSRAPPTASSRR